VDYNICECCGTEFGNDDEFYSYEELRNRWVAGGAPWFFYSAPVGWNPWMQLFNAQVGNLPFDAALGMVGTEVQTAEKVLESTNDDVYAYAA
jgi:hypothetical protein